MKITIENAMSNFAYYKEYIPQHYHKQLEGSPSQFTILGARSESDFVGIILARKKKKLSIMQIIHIGVSESDKNTGLEEMFFYVLEDIARNEKIESIHYEYIGDKNGTLQYMDGILRKNSWSSLQPNVINFILKRNEIEGKQWFEKYYKNNVGFSYFEWGLLQFEERFELLEGEGKWYTKKSSPFLAEEKIDQKFSIGVKHDGKVIGWFLIQEISKQLIVYKTLFIKEEYWNVQNCIQLLMIGIMQALKQRAWQYLMIRIDDENEHLRPFIERALRPAILNKIIVSRSEKKL